MVGPSTGAFSSAWYTKCELNRMLLLGLRLPHIDLNNGIDFWLIAYILIQNDLTQLD